jgi:hypothetical protein
MVLIVGKMMICRERGALYSSGDTERDGFEEAEGVN